MPKGRQKKQIPLVVVCANSPGLSDSFGTCSCRALSSSWTERPSSGLRTLFPLAAIGPISPESSQLQATAVCAIARQIPDPKSNHK